ncbi:hypothetical protein X975_25468, partial [Stegodyphus mimosarum]
MTLMKKKAMKMEQKMMQRMMTMMMRKIRFSRINIHFPFITLCKHDFFSPLLTCTKSAHFVLKIFVMHFLKVIYLKVELM